jgi:hypothetical protein
LSAAHPSLGSVARPELPSPRQRSSYGFNVSEMAFFLSTNLYNPPTTATPIIRRLGKISYFISPAKEGGYAKGTERRTFSMTTSKTKRADNFLKLPSI